MNPPPPAEGLASRLFAGPALRTQSDRRLVTLVREGYESAFEEIVRRYAKPLGRYAAGIVGSRSEDVTQDAFSKALLALRKEGEADIELRPWLYRIVRNTALNDLRDGPPTALELTEPLAGGTPSAAHEFERRQELEELLERLRALPDPQRAAIVMRELEGLGHEEIASSLGVSGGAALQAIFRARQALRDGVGLLIPLPVIRMLLEQGAGAEAGIAAGGAALAAGGATGAAGGTGAALKVGLVTAVLAGSVGTGLAVKDRPHDRDPDAAAAATLPGPSGPAAEAVAGSPGGGAGSSGTRAGEDEAESGDSSGRGDDDDRGRRGDDGDDRSGPDRGDDDDRRDRSEGRRSDDDDSGQSGTSGHGGNRGPGGGDDDDSGSDDGDGVSGGSGTSGGGSGTGGSGTSGSGTGGSGSYQPPPPSDEDSSSGSGSGEDLDSDSSGSGSGEYDLDSSGSGSGGES